MQQTHTTTDDMHACGSQGIGLKNELKNYKNLCTTTIYLP